ncbi:MAG TPA: GNAT family N-acetyltransferase [Anaerolineales bacterium]
MTILQTALGEVLIRPSKPEDGPAYRALRLEALKNHPTAFGADHDENLLHPDEHWQKRVTTDDEREALFFAEHEGNLIGMTGIYRESGRKAQHSAQVWGVYVRPEWRGAHIADRLIEECLSWAYRKGIVIAMLGVSIDNEAAIRCYERCGFTKVGTWPKAIQVEGQFVDEYIMACSLENH